MLIYGCHPCEEYINSTLLHRKHQSGWRKSRECKTSEQSEAAEQGKERNRERQRNRARSGTEKGAEQSEAAEQRKAAEAPHGQGRTKKSLKPDWEEAGAGTAAEAYPKQYNHDNDK